MKSAVAIRHVPFEDLGTLEALLRSRSYEIRYVDAGIDDVSSLDLNSIDLMIVLGGPIGAYEDDVYPFLKDELMLLKRRLEAGRPTIGICLGAQLMARALGARVYPSGTKEIGWKPVSLTAAGRESSLRFLSQPGMSVLHWHGDTFEMPNGATLLASTDLCTNQAFSWGPNALALQFHLEAAALRLEQWYIGHACELAAAKISVAGLRAGALKYAAILEPRARNCFDDWLTTVESR